MNKILYVIIIISLFVQCTTNYKSKRINLKRIDRNELITFAESVNPEYTSISIKYSADIEKDGTSNHVSGNIRIIKDSSIWINFNLALGINLGRALFEIDSFQVVNYRDKTHYYGPYSKSEKVLGTNINYHVLQNILTSSFFLPKELKFHESSFDIKENVEGEFVLNQNYKDFTSNIRMDSKSYKIKEFMVAKSASPINVTVSYKDYVNIEGRILPQNLIIVFNDKGNKTSLDLTYSKITIDKDVKIPFRVPEKYNSIEIK